MQPRVLVTLRIPESHLVPELYELAEVKFATDPGKAMSRAEALASVADVDAIISQGELKVDAELIAAAPRLKIVANVAIGTDNLDKPALAARGIRATNAPDAFTEATADVALGLLLAAARKLAEGDRYLRTGEWERDGFHPVRWEGMLLSGKVLGIVGFGAIGRAVARRAEAFGMRVIFNRSQPDLDPRYRDLDRLLKEADVVSLHTPLTAATHHLIHTDRLAAMKPGAILINLARGKVVDEEALVAALQSGQLSGAGLDVFENEPVVHPALLDMPNVVLCPHVGGSAVEARQAARLLASENVLRVLRGDSPVEGSVVV
ncbi:MAG: glyoxylate reductase [Verrucomicrobiales bacterium]